MPGALSKRRGIDEVEFFSPSSSSRQGAFPGLGGFCIETIAEAMRLERASIWRVWGGRVLNEVSHGLGVLKAPQSWQHKKADIAKFESPRLEPM
jgi:hypothetical protein